MAKMFKHPLDFDNLEKGSIIEIEEVEKIIGHKKGTEKYSMGCYQLQIHIRREMRNRGKPVTVKHVKGALHILTDEEAVDYWENREGLALGQVFFVHQSRMEIDRSNLDDQKRKHHDSELERSGKLLQSMIASQALPVAILPYKRTTPTLSDFLNGNGEHNPPEEVDDIDLGGEHA